MPSQRARGAESRVRNRSSNGPLRVQSNARLRRVFCNVLAYVSCRGYVSISLKCMVYHECRVAPRIKRIYSSLAERFGSVGDFLFSAYPTEIRLYLVFQEEKGICCLRNDGEADFGLKSQSLILQRLIKIIDSLK